jgi:hypothetical protein
MNKLHAKPHARAHGTDMRGHKQKDAHSFHRLSSGLDARERCNGGISTTG